MNDDYCVCLTFALMCLTLILMWLRASSWTKHIEVVLNINNANVSDME